MDVAELEVKAEGEMGTPRGAVGMANELRL